MVFSNLFKKKPKSVEKHPTKDNTKKMDIIHALAKKYLGDAKILAEFIGHRYSAFTEDQLFMIKEGTCNLENLSLGDGVQHRFVSREIPLKAIVEIAKSTEIKNTYTVNVDFEQVKDQPAELVIEQKGKRLSVSIISGNNSNKLDAFMNKLSKKTNISITSL
ncbi:hypothetical protein HOD83_01210 [Candidatus Woesearchaeota archaeon]|jgi:hypothetical protein|nr:hypothetical protein [Candidatus Woesearchaeota archaeon]MBT4114480.1 hypothetical protein [Candidatus Woesearchaeota archaeon]MBT4248190.1 hypothetical protein [Candidatus Woesearchaeota archaeon]